MAPPIGSTSDPRPLSERERIRSQSRESEDATVYVALLPSNVGASLKLDDFAVLAAVILAVEVVVIGGHVIIAGLARKLCGRRK